VIGVTRAIRGIDSDSPSSYKERGATRRQLDGARPRKGLTVQQSSFW
jgi:hypothetical protein